MNKAQRMMIWPGIEGITRILARNKAGWHVYVDGDPKGYTEMSLAQALAYYSAGSGARLGWVTGNELFFTTPDPHVVPA